jgi:hypothetical protein
MQRFYKVTGLPDNAFASFVEDCQRRFETSIIANRLNPRSRSAIPRITHRIWLTAPHEPRDPPADYLTNWLKATRELPPDSSHFFWTNSNMLGSAIEEAAEAAGCHNVTVKSPMEFVSTAIMVRIDKLLASRKFVLAADMFKIVVLQRYGGIYSDLGIVYDQQIFELALHADYAFIVSNASFLQTSFLACGPASDLFNIFLGILHAPGALDPRYALMDTAPTALDEVHMFAGLGFTACVMLFLPGSMRALMLPAQSPNLLWASQESWYGTEPKHGNALITSTLPTLTEADEFVAGDQAYQYAVKTFGNQLFFEAQLRILITLHGFFEKHPTRMCHTFFYHGSDKALHWHNYAFVYNYIIGQMDIDIRNLLEVGIGTDYVDVLSTMGSSGVPGASLRAWKECLPEAHILGADIDVRILFQEPGIETYWVDQTSADAVRGLFENINHLEVDVVVDDGLHTFSANFTLMEGAYPKISRNGIYIIEDISSNELATWEKFFATSNLRATLIRLPHPTNDVDNCIAFIQGGQQWP